VPADLGLVTHAAERDADELAPERGGDRLGERRLADARRADETEDGALHVGLQLADRQVLDDAVLGLLEAGVVGVEHLLRAREIDHLVGALAPRQRHEPVDVGAGDGVLGGRGRHFREPIELAERLLTNLLGHAGGVDLGAQIVELLGLVVALAELLLNGLHLLTEQILALVLADLGLHLGLDLRAELEDLELLRQDAVQLIHALAHVGRRQQLLLERRADRGQARGEEIRQPARLVDIRRQRDQIVREHRREVDDLLKRRADIALEGVDFELIFRAEDVRQLAHFGPEVRAQRRQPIEREAREALHDEAHAAVGQLEHLMNVRERADAVQVALARLFLGRVALNEYADQLAAGDRLVDEAHRRLARHGERHEGIREEHGVAQRQHRHFRRNSEGAFGRPTSRTGGLVAHGHLLYGRARLA